MVSFFASSAAQPPAPRRASSWGVPPDNWVPGIAPVSLVVARSEDAAASVSRIAVFPTGFTFDVTGSLRTEPADGGPLGVMMNGPGGLLVGVEYADGSRGAHAPRGQSLPPSRGVSLLPQGGSGSATAFRQRFWAAPLPPPGPVTFVVAWPARGLAESTATVEAAQLLEAADRAIQLWPDEPDALPEVDFTHVALPPAGLPPADPEAAQAGMAGVTIPPPPPPA